MLQFRMFACTESRSATHHSRRSPLSHLPFYLPSHLSLFTVVYPLSVQPFTKCSSRNSFVLKTIHFDGGVYPPPRRSDVQTFKPCDVFPSYPLSFHTLANSFAPRKIISLVLSRTSKLFAQNNRGWGSHFSSEKPFSPRAPKILFARTFSAILGEC